MLLYVLEVEEALEGLVLDGFEKTDGVGVAGLEVNASIGDGPVSEVASRDYKRAYPHTPLLHQN